MEFVYFILEDKLYVCTETETLSLYFKKEIKTLDLLLNIYNLT